MLIAEFLFLLLLILLGLWLLMRSGWLFYVLLLRIHFVHRLEQICHEKGYTVKQHRMLLASLLCHGDLPDISVIGKETEYLLRFVGGRGKKYGYYFITPEYYVRFMRLFRGRRSAHGFAHRKHLHPLREDFIKEMDGARSQPVLLGAPISKEWYYLNQDRKGRMRVTSGAMLGNWQFFGSDEFLNLLKAGPET